jgi:hypothetical protein
MRYSTILMAFAFVSATPCAATEVLTLPLELGASQLYLRPGEDYRLEFDAEYDLPDIGEVRLHLVGTYNNVRSICWDFGDFGGGTWSYSEDAGLFTSFLDEGIAVCATQHLFEPVVSEDTAYDLELVFQCGDEVADWSFLSPGSGVLQLMGLSCTHLPEFPEVCICEPSATVSSAELIIELNTGTPVETRDWGAIKSQYR